MQEQGECHQWMIYKTKANNVSGPEKIVHNLTMSSSTSSSNEDLLHIHYRTRFVQLLETMKVLNKELNKSLQSLQVDPETEARNVLIISEKLAKANDQVCLLLAGLQQHQLKHNIALATRKKRDISLQSVRSTLGTLHETREALADVVEECRPEAEAAVSSLKRKVSLDSILQMSKRLRYTTAWPINHDLPPPKNKKGLPTPYSEPAPQEDHMKHYSLLFDGKEKYQQVLDARK